MNDTHKWQDDLAIRMGLEFHVLSEFFTESDMIVNFAIDGEDELSVFANERLCSRI